MTAERAYLDELARRIAEPTGDELVGVYVGGSFALGDYEPGRSDLDVAAVVESRLSADAKHAIVAATCHEALPCPARGLELVVYRREVVETPSTDPNFELNLNTGRSMTHRLDLETDPNERHWFTLDRAILAASGVPLIGPPAREVFASIPHELVIPLLRLSLEWYLRAEAPADDAVLNACRALLFASEGTWASKPAAGAWAAEHLPDAALVEDALAARTSGFPVDPARARAFVQLTLDRLGD
jgi:hypothetical protein